METKKKNLPREHDIVADYDYVPSAFIYEFIARDGRTITICKDDSTRND